MIRLYNFQGSGNSYKVRLLLTQLQVPFERIDIDLLAGETGKPGFRARNPLGQTPFIELDDGGVLAESNAILWYLAEGTSFLREDRWTRAQILQCGGGGLRPGALPGTPPMVRARPRRAAPRADHRGARPGDPLARGAPP